MGEITKKIIGKGKQNSPQKISFFVEKSCKLMQTWGLGKPYTVLDYSKRTWFGGVNTNEEKQ